MNRVLLASAAAALALGFGATAGAEETSRFAEAARVVQDVRADIPQDYWNRAHCAAVIPDLKKAAFVFGGEYGKGVMSCRSGQSWSAPLLLTLAKGSWGFQAGAEEVDLVLLVMNEDGVQKLLSNKVTLGADASVAAGPIGRQGAVATDAAMTAEILSYSRSKGLFAGVDLSGGVLRPDDDANREVYGRTATPATILATTEISAPPNATPFIRALGTGASTTETTPAATPSASSTTSDRRTTPPAQTAQTGRGRTATDEDIRARLIDMQQMLDRLLAETTPAAVGTSGAAGRGDAADGTVTVDRARLLQLRRQIELILASLK